MRTAKQQLKLLIAGILGVFLLAAAAIVAAGLNDSIADADIIIVPGNTVAPDGTPVPRLRARLDSALQLFQQGRAPLIFVSGGVGKEGFDEAAAMASYLVKNGVPASAIVQDPLGLDTAATARNAAAFMQTRRLQSALVATQYFHVPRTRLALARHGVRVAGSVHARYFELRDLYSIPREVIGYVVYFVKS